LLTCTKIENDQSYCWVLSEENTFSSPCPPRMFGR
jgi:hypothetical protein